ncbi:MAG TPA: sulfur carrier protein ThiS [Burkholderiaceae bacterium]|nr:sulfur carrier protein ThiS [Burkholderiaceae bacterium]
MTTTARNTAADTTRDAAPGTMSIRLDGKPCSVAPGTTLASLVAALGHAPAGVGTAVNGSFVPRSQRDRMLAPGDSVLLFKPITGG